MRRAGSFPGQSLPDHRVALNRFGDFRGSGPPTAPSRSRLGCARRVFAVNTEPRPQGSGRPSGFPQIGHAPTTQWRGRSRACTLKPGDNRLNLRIAVTLVLCLPACGFQEPDAEGCKDSKLMSRFRGCVISECKSSEFDAAQVLTGRTPAAEEELKDVEGVLEGITYTCPERISALQLSRNAEGAIRQAGFTIVNSGKDAWDNPAVTGSKGGQWIFVRQSPG